jgi:WD40 repeat protein
MTKIYAKLNFVLKIDKQLNVLQYRNEFDSNDIGPTSADLKSTRQFRAESFAQINTNSSNRLLACAIDHDIQIWNLDLKKCVATCKSDAHLIYNLIKIDENRFVSGSKYGTIQIWSSRNFECLKSFRSEGQLFELRKLPNNQLGCYQEQDYHLFSSYFNIKIWSMDSGELVLTLSWDFSWIFEDSTILSNEHLIYPDERYIQVWEISRGECKLLKTITAHSSNIDELVSLNSEQVMSRSNGEPIKIWNTINWQCIKTLPGMVDWFKSLQSLTCMSMYLKPRSSEKEYAINPYVINVWDTTKKGNVIKKMDTSDRLIGGSYINQINAIVTYSCRGLMRVWDLKRLNCIETIQVPHVEFSLYDSIFI